MPTANPKATWTELILVTQSVIQDLGLVYGPQGTLLPSTQVYAWKLPTDGFRMPSGGSPPVVSFPCVQACAGRMEDVADSIQDFEDTELIYPVVVLILFSSNHGLAINNDLFYWRQLIFDAFQDFPDSLRVAVEAAIDDVNVFDCQITTQAAFDPSVFQKENLDFGWLVLNYKTTRDRGR